MCNNCNCDNYDLCSIVGHMPAGFCCSKCELYDEARTCMKMKTKHESSATETNHIEHIEPINAKIKNGIIQVDLSVGDKDEKIPIYIDLKKQFESD
jgi:hypothetical protein